MTGIKWVRIIHISQQVWVFLFGNWQKPPELIGSGPSTRKLPAQPGRVGTAGDKGPGNSASVWFSKERELSHTEHSMVIWKRIKEREQCQDWEITNSNDMNPGILPKGNGHGQFGAHFVLQKRLRAAESPFCVVDSGKGTERNTHFFFFFFRVNPRICRNTPRLLYYQWIL